MVGSQYVELRPHVGYSNSGALVTHKTKVLMLGGKMVGYVFPRQGERPVTISLLATVSEADEAKIAKRVCERLEVDEVKFSKRSKLIEEGKRK